MRRLLVLFLLVSLGSLQGQSDATVARQWNEVYLFAIRNDFARPVVHARNLYHSSAAMYDSWALTHGRGITALVRDAPDVPQYSDPASAAEEALSYAAYRILLHRYQFAPRFDSIRGRADSLMSRLGYDVTYRATDYRTGDAAALGNYVAAEILVFGSADGANEALNYGNDGYPDPVNPPLYLDRPFSILSLTDPNRWQPLAFPGSVVDQSGNPIGSIPGFLGASWGRVTPFAIPDSARTLSTATAPIYGESPVYHDPGPPPLFAPDDTAQLNLYRWNFETVLKWSSHLDPADSVMWNISPAARGNRQQPLPRTPAEYRAFYKQQEGGQPGSGYAVNPVTGQPYPDNIVPRGDYTRVLAEFWADGLSSETPPGHWFAILNKVMDHPLFSRELWGEGAELDPLEYDVKAYLTLGGAMHDAAITAWSIKGKYDYVRPITAIRYLAVRGQSSLPDAPHYDPYGLRLDPGFIELAESGNDVVNDTSLLTVRARAWTGNSFIDDAAVETAGVDWINPAVWEPYQRPNFVTPNFAGYISGHSTFSMAAATVLTELTGTRFFPGGVGEFIAKKNEFLVFEEGPSVDVVLQWATYQDAAAETSLSRIWGGIHPPADDIPGRRIGRAVGLDASTRAEALFRGDLTSVAPPASDAVAIGVYPNPVGRGYPLTVDVAREAGSPATADIYNSTGVRVATQALAAGHTRFATGALPAGVYLLRIRGYGPTVKFQVF